MPRWAIGQVRDACDVGHGGWRGIREQMMRVRLRWLLRCILLGLVRGGRRGLWRRRRVIAASESINLRKGEAGMAMVAGAWLTEARHDARDREERGGGGGSDDDARTGNSDSTKAKIKTRAACKRKQTPETIGREAQKNKRQAQRCSNNRNRNRNDRNNYRNNNTTKTTCEITTTRSGRLWVRKGLATDGVMSTVGPGGWAEVKRCGWWLAGVQISRSINKTRATGWLLVWEIGRAHV